MTVLTGRPARTVTRSDGLIELREPGGVLLALFDPARQVLLFQHRRAKTLADLRRCAADSTGTIDETGKRVI
jgi:hypothetical protein